MKHVSGARLALVSGAIAVLVLASSAVAGATSIKGVYSATAAKLVPATYKGKTLQVGTDASYAPDESMSGSKIVGFDIDIIHALATTLGLKITENNVTFDNIIPGIQSGKYAIGNSSFTDNKKREKQVNFVDYFQAGEGVYAPTTSSATFKGFSSFCGHTVAVETGTVELTDAGTANKACASGHKITIRSFPNQNEANAAVFSGQATYGFVDSQIAGYIVAHSQGRFKLIGSAINVAPYGIATAKTPSGLALAKAIQAAFKVMIANGTYHAVLAKWGFTAGGLASSKIVLNGALS
jgi:polar amino acid transport system substrate-binding protein